MSETSLHASTYALWLTPEEGAARPVSECIRRLAGDLAGPVFEPHLTLASGLAQSEPELRRRSSLLSTRLRSFEVSTEGFGLADPPFRALFLPARSSTALLEARTLALQTFGLPASVDFLPHLSLFYGDLSGKDLSAILRSAAGLSHWKAPLRMLQLIAAFGPPSRWKILHSYALSGE